MFDDRALGAFLGLALGDAFGRSLEFVGCPRVRSQAVRIPSDDFMWTDDTHMALFLVDALEALSAPELHPLSEDAFGAAVGAAFVRWSKDPLTPSTAPGNTCLAGSARFARTGDWRRSGIRESDGCGAVMRVAPLPILLDEDDLISAAHVQAVVTHAHPNAPASAIAACLLLRDLLDGADLNAAWVCRTLDRLACRSLDTPAVAGALRAAVLQAERPTLEWLDEANIPDGDGGWRSPSALGLALVAALRWTDNPRIAIEKAARIGGDSDSVACLTGMFLGALHGVHGLPADWLAALPHRDSLEQATTRLLHHKRLLTADPTPTTHRARTSVTDPIQVAWLPVDAGLRNGRIGLTFAPGKHAPSTIGRPWARDLTADLHRLREDLGVDVLVSLVEDTELDWMQISTLVPEAEARGIAVIRHPVVDGDVPESGPAAHTVRAAVSLARSGRSVVFHCRGGLGRAGTFAALALGELGWSAEPAMVTVRSVRPGAIENHRQEDFIRSAMAGR